MDWTLLTLGCFKADVGKTLVSYVCCWAADCGEHHRLPIDEREIAAQMLAQCFSQLRLRTASSGAKVNMRWQNIT